MAETALPLERQLAIRRTRTVWHILRNVLSHGLPVIALSVLTLVVMYPFLFVIFMALKSDVEMRVNPLGIPHQLVWQNFAETWVRGNFGIYFKNSVMIVIPVVVAVIFVSLLAGYAFGRMRFWGRDVLFVYFVAGLGLPLEAILIPLYFTMLDLNLLNTYWSVILPMVGLIMPFGILLLTGFIQAIPEDLISAARVDGASDWQILWDVVAPIAYPGIVTLLVFAFLWTWNQFYLPTVMITDNDFRTLPTGLNFFIGAYYSDLTLLAAGTLITAAPVVLLYLFFQREFINGVTVGSLK
jgi:raffinose/stachyose/melibiose transport system permease protein